MKDSFVDLFEYDHWANTRWLDRLRAIGDVAPRTRELMAHIPAAKQIWIARIHGTYSAEMPIWPSLDWDENARLLDATRDAYRAFLDDCSADDLQADAVYQNSKGVAYRTPVHEVLMHVATHGNYHRGQIAQAVRRQGAEPINTDYITYLRRR